MHKFSSFLIAVTFVLTPFSQIFAASDTSQFQTSFNFTHLGKDGTFAVYCSGTLVPTDTGGESDQITPVCDGQSSLEVSWNSKTTRYTLDTRLPSGTNVVSYSRPQDAGVIWYSPRVINGTQKKFLVIQNNTWENLYGGVGGAPSATTLIYDFTAQKFSQLVNPSGRKLIWNKAGTRALFVDLSCGGAGCDATSAIKGLTLTSKQATTLTKMKAAFEGDWSQALTSPTFDLSEKFLPTWKRLRWVTDQVFEATYVTADGKIKTVRGTF